MSSVVGRFLSEIKEVLSHITHNILKHHDHNIRKQHSISIVFCMYTHAYSTWVNYMIDLE